MQYLALTKVLLPAAIVFITLTASPAQAQNTQDRQNKGSNKSKTELKKVREEKFEEKKEEKQAKAHTEIDKVAEKDAEKAQSRKEKLPRAEDHHKLGSHYEVDKGFDFESNPTGEMSPHTRP